jgi:hypothetical protein
VSSPNPSPINNLITPTKAISNFLLHPKQNQLEETSKKEAAVLLMDERNLDETSSITGIHLASLQSSAKRVQKREEKHSLMLCILWLHFSMPLVLLAEVIYGRFRNQSWEIYRTSNPSCFSSPLFTRTLGMSLLLHDVIHNSQSSVGQ